MATSDGAARVISGISWVRDRGGTRADPGVEVRLGVLCRGDALRDLALGPTVIAARTLDRLAAVGHGPFDPAVRSDSWAAS